MGAYTWIHQGLYSHTQNKWVPGGFGFAISFMLFVCSKAYLISDSFNWAPNAGSVKHNMARVTMLT